MNGEGGFVMRNVLMAFVTLTLTLSVAFVSYAMDGWRQQEGGWYYYQNEQRLADQWINENGDTYYLGPDGRMLTGYHLIDGYLYSFMSDGKLFKYTGTDVWRDHKVITTDGRGVLAAMDQEDALFGSTCVQWMDQTYGIYTKYKDEKEVWADLHFTQLPSDETLMARDWGLTDKEGGISMVNHLFSEGVATDDKAVKAWDFSRAMMLCSSMRGARWMDMVEYRTMQYAMAPTIQQSFSSWEDFFDHYMTAYRQWDSSVGHGESKEREAAYEQIKKVMDQNDEDKWIPWDKALVKYW